MASTFPTTKDTYTTKVNGDVIDASHIDNVQDAILALETKVGVDNSADPASLDHKVNSPLATPAHKHTLAGSLTDVNAPSPADGQGLVYNTATSKWIPATTAVADASTSVKGVTKMSVAPAVANNPIAVGDNDTRVQNSSYANKGIVQGLTDAATSGLNIASGVISVNSGTGANQIVKLDGSGKLPAVDGSLLIINYNPYVSVASSTSIKANTGTFNINNYGTAPGTLMWTNTSNIAGTFNPYATFVVEASQTLQITVQVDGVTQQNPTYSTGTYTNQLINGSILVKPGSVITMYGYFGGVGTSVTGSYIGGTVTKSTSLVI